MASIKSIIENAFLDENLKMHILEQHVFWDWDPVDKKSQFTECSELVFRELTSS